MTVPAKYLSDVPIARGHRGHINVHVWTADRLHEAEISAANRYVGEYTSDEPLIDVENVVTLEWPEDGEKDWQAIVEVDTSTEMLQLGDVRVFHGFLNDHIGEMRHSGLTGIYPGVDVNQPTPTKMPQEEIEPNVMPKVVTRVETNRYTQQEFREGLESMTATYTEGGQAILGMEQEDGRNVGYIIGNGLSLSDASKLDKDSFGPGGKSVTETYYDAVPVNVNEYEKFIDQSENLPW